MKIYMFNQETGVYLGEDFADTPLKNDEKAIIPPDATTIAPPRVEQGEILRFNPADQRWDVHSRVRLKRW